MVKQSKPQRAESGTEQFLSNFIPGVCVGIVVLMFEYWTGLFQSVTPSSPIASLSRIAPVINTFVIVCCLVFLIRCVWVWFNTYRYIREEFALPATLTIAFAVTGTMVSLFSGQTPWYVVESIVRKLLGQDIPAPQLLLSDWIALLSLSALVIMMLMFAYRSWAGLRSEREVIREAHSELPGLLSDAQAEFSRIWHRQPPLKEHVEELPASTFEVRAAAPRSIAWKDQSLELLHLSSTNYIINLSRGWHEPPGCWVGSNRAGEQFVLYPVQNMPTDAELESLLVYIDRLRGDAETRRLEIIVMPREGTNRQERILASKTIRIEPEQVVIDQLLDLVDYRESIRRRVEEDTLPESTLTLRDVYVSPQFKDSVGESYVA